MYNFETKTNEEGEIENIINHQPEGYNARTGIYASSYIFQGDWEDESGLSGRVTVSENNVWKVEIKAPESAEMSMYNLRIDLLKIGGIRETIVVSNAIEIIEREKSKIN